MACTVPMATTIEECRKIVELTKKTGLTYMMMETVVYSREYLFVKELYDKGELGQGAVPPGEPSAGNGRLAGLLGRASPDALCDALRGSLPGADGRGSRIRLLLRLRADR